MPPLNVLHICKTILNTKPKELSEFLILHSTRGSHIVSGITANHLDAREAYGLLSAFLLLSVGFSVINVIVEFFAKRSSLNSDYNSTIH